MPLWRQPKKSAHIRCPAEPSGVINQGYEAERVDRTNTGDCHQASRDRMDLGRFPHRLVQVVRHLAQLGMGRDEGIGYGPQNRVGLTRCRQLIAERLPLFPLANADHTDPEGFEDATNVAFEVLAQPDQPFPRTYQAAKPVGVLATDVNRREPASSGELRQPFGIGGVRLVEPGREALVRLARVDAGGRKPESRHPALQPNRQVPTLMYNPARHERAVSKPACHTLGIGWASAARDRLAITIHNTDRNLFQRNIQTRIVFHRSFSSRHLSMRPTYLTSFAPGERPPQSYHVL